MADRPSARQLPSRNSTVESDGSTTTSKAATSSSSSGDSTIPTELHPLVIQRNLRPLLVQFLLQTTPQEFVEQLPKFFEALRSEEVCGDTARRLKTIRRALEEYIPHVQRTGGKEKRKTAIKPPNGLSATEKEGPALYIPLGRCYSDLYHRTIIQLTPAASRPSVLEVDVWMTWNLLLSNPYFRIFTSSSPLPHAAATTAAAGGASHPSQHQHQPSRRVAYPARCSELRMLWDWDQVWAAAAAIKKKPGGGEDGVHVFSEGLYQLLVPDPPAATGAPSPWTTMHALYYLTTAKGARGLDDGDNDSDSCSDAKQRRMVVCSRFLHVIRNHVDANLTDNCGDGRMCSDPVSVRSASAVQEPPAREEQRNARYRQLPMVGLSAAVNGNPLLTHVATSFVASGAAPGQGSSLAYLLQLFLLHQYQWHSTPGGVYNNLFRINRRLVYELATHLCAAPLSVPQLAVLMRWHSSENAIAELFRQGSFFFFLLCIAGNPLVHLRRRRELEAAPSLRRALGAIDTAKRNRKEKKRRPRVSNAIRQRLPLQRCYDFEEGNSQRIVESADEDLWEEKVKWADMHARANTITIPSVTEDLVLFLLLPAAAEGGSRRDGPLLSSIRGVPLRRLQVLNTKAYPPVDLFDAVAEEVRKVPESSSADAMHQVGNRVGSSHDRPFASAATSPAEWTAMEHHLWCLPASVLFHRLLRVARAWCWHHQQHHEQPQQGEQRWMRLTVGEWCRAALWDVEWGGDDELGSEMLWAVLAVADPHQSTHQLASAYSDSDSIREVAVKIPFTGVL